MASKRGKKVQFKSRLPDNTALLEDIRRIEHPSKIEEKSGGSLPPAPPPPPLAPPKPPAPPPTVSDVGNSNLLPSYYEDPNRPDRIKIKPQDLIKGKRSLTATNAGKLQEAAKLDRSELFDKFQIYTHLPLQLMLDNLMVFDAGGIGNVVSLNLTGVEQMTDFFFYCFEVLQIRLPKLRFITLTGSLNITDQGISWLLRALSSGVLTELVLKGCRNVTERTIHNSLRMDRVLNHLDLTATGCSAIPSEMSGKFLGSFNLHGCPLISPPTDIYTKSPRGAMLDATFYPYGVYKVVVLEQPEWALKEGLFSSRSQNEGPGFLATRGWKTGVKSDPYEYNVFEVIVGSDTEDMFLGNGGIMIFTFQDTEDSAVQKVALQIMTVLGQYRENLFILACTGTEDKGKEMKDKVVALMKTWLEYMKVNQEYGLHNKKHFYLNELKFSDQLMLGYGTSFMDYIDFMIHPGSDMYLRTVHLPNGKDPKKFSFLSESVQIMKDLYPWYTTNYFLQTVKSMHTIEENKNVPIATMNKIVQDLPEEMRFNFNPRSGYQEICKVMELLHDKGTCLFFPKIEKHPACTNLSQFESMMHSIFVKPAPQKLSLRGLGNDIPCWLYSDFRKQVKLNSGSMRLLLIDVLLDLGLLLRFPLDVSNPETQLDTLAYVLTKDLPVKPDVPINSLWQDDLPEGERQIEMYYTFPCLPNWLFPYFLRQLCETSRYILVWKSGILLLQGPVTVLVELLHNNRAGLPSIVVCARMKNYEDKKQVEMMEVTFKNITTQLQSILMSKKVYVVKTVCCKTCNPAQNRLKALDDSSEFVHFTEMLIRARHDRGLYCNKEGNPDNVISKKNYLGPDNIRWMDCVPNHTELASQKNYHKMSTASRCYLCNNCVIDGLICSSKFKNGVTNRHCGCKKQAILCNHCGVCQRCVITLARAHTTVQPHFETRVDDKEATVRRNGCSIGFAKEEKEYEFPLCMTLEYFNKLEMIFTRGCFYVINCYYSKKMRNVMSFATGTGIVTVDGEEKKTGLMCKTGDLVDLTIIPVTNDGEVTMLMLRRNKEVVFSMELIGNKTKVAIKAVRPGNIIINTPNFMRMQASEFETEESEADDKHRHIKCCGSFPTILERKMSMIIMKMEQILFKNHRVEMTGSSGVFLPDTLSKKDLLYPTFNVIRSPKNFHPMCMTRSNTGLEIEGDHDDWIMANLVHLVNASGFKMTDEMYDITKHLVWGWLCLVSHYPQIDIPGKIDKLLPAWKEDPDTTMICAGLLELFRLFSLDLLLSFGINYNLKTFNQIALLDAAALEIQSSLDDFSDVTGLVSTESSMMPGRVLYLCSGHVACWQVNEDLSSIPSNVFGDYSFFITSIKLPKNQLKAIAPDAFKNLPNLLKIDLSENFLTELPDTVGSCKKLRFLDVSDNNLTDLPMSMGDCPQIYRIDISRNSMDVLPPVLTKFYNLVRLVSHDMMISVLPENLGNLAKLQKFYFNGNCLKTVPKSLAKLEHCDELSFVGINWVKDDRKASFLSRKNFENFLEKRGISRWLDAHTKEKEALLKQFDAQQNATLDTKGKGKLNAIMFNMFPRFGYKGLEAPEDHTPSGFPEEIFQLRSLNYLNISFQGIVHVPAGIKNLTSLQTLVLTDNPNLLSLAAETGQCPLKRLMIDNCPLLKTPPKEIRDRGFTSTYAYLRRLLTGSVECKRTKLMLVGLGGVGKTSLVRALKTNALQKDLTTPEEITDGIDICTWEVDFENERVSYSVWDFAGQTVYNNTHQFFLSNRAVYLLVWNVRQGHEHAGLDFWFNSISVHAPSAPIFVVGTHIDEVSRIELPMEQMQETYSQIKGFHFVSSYNGEGMDSLKSALFKATLQEEYMGEQIPEAWLQFESILLNLRTQREEDVLEYSEVEKKATEAGILDKVELAQAVQFLHDLGSVQHFTNEYLKSKVVINPQWLVDVMACVVSVKQSVIKDGRLKHSDIGKVWKDYPEDMHQWLLRLTEAFDLTYPLEGEYCNVVPCLLPETPAKFDWPEIEKNDEVYETKMVYNFNYLPTGLFNRGQVRLHETSDDNSKMWKRGFFVSKKGQIAILEQVRDSDLHVKVQGTSPENLLLAVHEVFEGLINESFQGLVYDYQIPCTECTKQRSKDPHMFRASIIRRAIALNAPFLQCLASFHMPMVVSLQGILAPDTNSDFEIHMNNMVNDLETIKDAMSVDIFISYCIRDAPSDRSKVIHPKTICEDLEKAGYSCYFPEGLNLTSKEEMAKALINASMVLVCISDKFAEDEVCYDMLKFAIISLNKKVQYVALGDGFGWRSSRLGVFLTDAVFVNMTLGKKSVYNSKLEELLKSLEKMTQSSISMISQKADCFISYAWSNSHEAVQLGTRKNLESLGYGDPRAIKKYLTDKGISCWLDIEQIGVGGIFEDLAKGLSNAQVVVACVSDEYANSAACKKEFLHAVLTLHLPVVLAVVGTKNQWQFTEIGFHAYQYPRVNFQTENPNSFEELFNYVKPLIKKRDDNDGAEKKKKKDEANQQKANSTFQDMYELAQRKFLRQITNYAGAQDIGHYPRLFVVDFMDTPASEKKTDTETSSNSEDSTDGKEMSSNPEAYKLRQYCVRTLCECEQAWHEDSMPIVLPKDFATSQLEEYAGYLARVTAILKHSVTIFLNLSKEPDGQHFMRALEQIALKGLSDYQTQYHQFRQMVSDLDNTHLMGNLKRCRLQTGKTIWLCQDHIKKMKLTVLSEEVLDSKPKTTSQAGVDHLVEGLRAPHDTISFPGPEKVNRVPTEKVVEDVEKDLRRHMTRSSSQMNKAALTQAINEVKEEEMEKVQEEVVKEEVTEAKLEREKPQDESSPMWGSGPPVKKKKKHKHKKEKAAMKATEENGVTEQIVLVGVKDKVGHGETEVENSKDKKATSGENITQIFQKLPDITKGVKGQDAVNVTEDKAESSVRPDSARSGTSRTSLGHDKRFIGSVENLHRFKPQPAPRKTKQPEPLETPKEPKAKSKLCHIM